MKVALGKQPYKHDERTLKMGAFLRVPPTLAAPITFDLDKGRSKLPMGLWGNDEWGDCVMVGRGNQLVRLERLDSRVTVPLTTEMIVDEYKRMTGAQTPGDTNDTGLVMLDAMNAWRAGWKLPVYKTGRTYPISAYGLLDVNNQAELREAIYLLGGIQFGLALPRSAYDQIEADEPWSFVVGPNSAPGSWGGHCVYAKRYDADGIYCITWGREQYMTNDFIAQYADEAWAVVDTLEGHRHYLNSDAMLQELRDIGATGIA